MIIDIHTHILPGLDDGARDLDEALQMARMACADGIQGVVATPHVAAGLYEHSREVILKAVGDFKAVLAAEGIPLKVYPGAEYMLEPDLPRRLSAGEMVTLNDGGRYLLVELPFTSVPPFAEQTFFEIMMQGIKPIIAHPERNAQLQKDPGQLRRFLEKGVLVQVNVGSIKGLFGEKAKKAGEFFLDKGYIHLLASDAHSAGQRPPVLTKHVLELKTQINNAAIDLLTITNPERLIQGRPIKDIEIKEPEQDKKPGIISRFFSRLG